MLSVDELRSRTYDERMEDVMREIPIRSSEWTNYNASDPGITILENMTAFTALQGSEIVTLSYRAKMALLNTACCGKFSSDRTIQEYVDEVWKLDKVELPIK